MVYVALTRAKRSLAVNADLAGFLRHAGWDTPALCFASTAEVPVYRIRPEDDGAATIIRCGQCAGPGDRVSVLCKHGSADNGDVTNTALLALSSVVVVGSSSMQPVCKRCVPHLPLWSGILG